MQMKKIIQMLAIAFMMAIAAHTSCGWNVGKSDSTLAYFDTIHNVEYVCMSETHNLDASLIDVLIELKQQTR